MFSFFTDFYKCFSVIFIVIVFFHVTNFLYSGYFFVAFLSGTSFLCCCTVSPTDLRGLFLLSDVFTLHSFLKVAKAFLTLRRFLPYTPSRHLAQPFFIKDSLAPGSSSLKAAGPPNEV